MRGSSPAMRRDLPQDGGLTRHPVRRRNKRVGVSHIQISSVNPREATEESALISVIIPAVNEAETLGATLASVRAQTVPFEIMVVDAQSTDETLALARSAGCQAG